MKMGLFDQMVWRELMMFIVAVCNLNACMMCWLSDYFLIISTERDLEFGSSTSWEMLETLYYGAKRWERPPPSLPLVTGFLSVKSDPYTEFRHFPDRLGLQQTQEHKCSKMLQWGASANAQRANIETPKESRCPNVLVAIAGWSRLAFSHFRQLNTA